MALYQIIEQTDLYTIFEETTLETAIDVVYDTSDLYNEFAFGTAVANLNNQVCSICFPKFISYIKKELEKTKTVDLPEELNRFGYWFVTIKILKENGITYSEKNKHFKKYKPPTKKQQTISKQLLNTLKRELCYWFRNFVKDEHDVYIKIEDLTMNKTFDKALQMAFKLDFDINKSSTNNKNVTKTYHEWVLYNTTTRQYEQTVVDLTIKEFDKWYDEQLSNYKNK